MPTSSVKLDTISVWPLGWSTRSRMTGLKDLHFSVRLGFEALETLRQDTQIQWLRLYLHWCVSRVSRSTSLSLGADCFPLRRRLTGP